MKFEIPIVVNGLGIVGNFGCGATRLKTAINEQAGASISMLAHQYGEVAAIQADTSQLKEFISPRLTRRMDKFTRLALLASILATKDANIVEGAQDKPTGLIIATGFGAVQTTFDFMDSFIVGGDHFASPTRFTNSLHNAAASNISLILKLEGPCATITAFEHSFVNALLTAYSWIYEGRVSRVILGTVDEVCPMMGYCYERYFGKTAARVQPEQTGVHSAILGEGSAFFVLEREGEATTGKPYARIDAVLSNATIEDAAFDTDSIYIGADGNQLTNPQYAALKQKIPTRYHSLGAYTGSFPTAHAFDFAAAISNVFEDEHRETMCLRFNTDQSMNAIRLTRDNGI